MNVLLGPNAGPLGRTPLGGRNWEGFSIADPYLSGKMCAETIVGHQDAGVIANLKVRDQTLKTQRWLDHAGHSSFFQMLQQRFSPGDSLQLTSSSTSSTSLEMSKRHLGVPTLASRLCHRTLMTRPCMSCISGHLQTVFEQAQHQSCALTTASITLMVVKTVN